MNQSLELESIPVSKTEDLKPEENIESLIEKEQASPENPANNVLG